MRNRIARIIGRSLLVTLVAACGIALAACSQAPDPEQVVRDQITSALDQVKNLDDATIDAVLKAMLAIKGVRLSQNPSQFDYSVKPNTDVVLEMLTLSFTRPWKGLSANG